MLNSSPKFRPERRNKRARVNPFGGASESDDEDGSLDLVLPDQGSVERDLGQLGSLSEETQLEPSAQLALAVRRHGIRAVLSVLLNPQPTINPAFLDALFIGEFLFEEIFIRPRGAFANYLLTIALANTPHSTLIKAALQLCGEITLPVHSVYSDWLVAQEFIDPGTTLKNIRVGSLLDYVTSDGDAETLLIANSADPVLGPGWILYREYDEILSIYSPETTARVLSFNETVIPARFQPLMVRGLGAALVYDRNQRTLHTWKANDGVTDLLQAASVLEPKGEYRVAHFEPENERYDGVYVLRTPNRRLTRFRIANGVVMRMDLVYFSQNLLYDGDTAAGKTFLVDWEFNPRNPRAVFRTDEASADACAVVHSTKWRMGQVRSGASYRSRLESQFFVMPGLGRLLFVPREAATSVYAVRTGEQFVALNTADSGFAILPESLANQIGFVVRFSEHGRGPDGEFDPDGLESAGPTGPPSLDAIPESISEI